jgi:very-short-patch-repair endonuclease
MSSVIAFVLTAKAHRNLMSDDMNRISAMEVFGWTVARSNGRWAVLKDTNSEMKVIGTTQPTLRQAIDAAVQIERTA